MKQLELLRDERGLFERLCTRAELEAGFLAVKRNSGSPGIDGISLVPCKSMDKGNMRSRVRTRTHGSVGRRRPSGLL
jgi:hypothetical protein